jgi:transposase
MPYPLSNDLRKRVVRFVKAGHSRHEAARHFGTSVSFVVNLMKRYHETGRIEPKPRGGFRHGKLGPHRVFILHQVEAKHDMSMPELAGVLRRAKGVEVAPATLSRFLIACGLSFKKNAQGIRTRQA